MSDTNKTDFLVAAMRRTMIAEEARFMLAEQARVHAERAAALRPVKPDEDESIKWIDSLRISIDPAHELRAMIEATLPDLEPLRMALLGLLDALPVDVVRTLVAGEIDKLAELMNLE